VAKAVIEARFYKVFENHFNIQVHTKAKKINLVFRATVLKTLGRVGSVLFFVCFKQLKPQL